LAVNHFSATWQFNPNTSGRAGYNWNGCSSDGIKVNSQEVMSALGVMMSRSACSLPQVDAAMLSPIVCYAGAGRDCSILLAIHNATILITRMHTDGTTPYSTISTSPCSLESDFFSEPLPFRSRMAFRSLSSCFISIVIEQCQ
jgi:hypothetical protein